ncbi:chorismate mutase [Clostridium botulinum C]|uniref:Chorismate mutase n=3 Tax=Clostridium botulinum TaxID=1491 RepID=A0A9Q4TQA1_CLOBO|nr:MULTISPECIES: chorismate mutase [Clostridium]EGO88996.1 chorismate mutase [Clostridium botulinum C str. Stockholm]EES92257.1 chorismate mutase [Clostridium botulinum D str. 1873]MBO3440930.1 chorismate mutase [Clostridium haemolyticum]MCD3195420.1 chorismate mutase [Clostridium botulinum C]MCD3200836.1 chorismate mutase [Clostridium botulinum C]
MDDLKELRKEIDLIDNKLISLFQKRMEAVLKVAEYKKNNNLPILNTSREQEVIDKNIKLVCNDNFKKPVEDFLRNIMSISKELQGKKMSE